MWLLQAARGDESGITEAIERQGTAWRRARRLYAAGFAVTATQYSIDDPPRPLHEYRFDGIRFVVIAPSRAL